MEGYLLAGEAFELADEVTFAALLVEAGWVEVGPEIEVAVKGPQSAVSCAAQDSAPHRGGVPTWRQFLCVQA